MLFHVGGVSLQLGEARVAGPDQGADLSGGQGGHLPTRPGMRAGDAAQRIADRRVTSIEGVPGLAVHPGDGGQPPPKRR